MQPDLRSLPAPFFLLRVLFNVFEPDDPQRVSRIVWSMPWLKGPDSHPAGAKPAELVTHLSSKPFRRLVEFGRMTLESGTLDVYLYVHPDVPSCDLAVGAYGVVPGLRGSRALVNEVVERFRDVGTELLRCMNGQAAVIGEEARIAGELTQKGWPQYAYRGRWGTGWPDRGGDAVTWYLDGFETASWLS